MPTTQALKEAKKRYYEKIKATAEYKSKIKELQKAYYKRNKERILTRVKDYQLRVKEEKQTEAEQNIEQNTGEPVLHGVLV